MKRVLSVFLTAALLVCLCTVSAFAEEKAENAGDAKEIATAEEFAAIAKDLSGNYVLTADIDLAGVKWTPIGTYAPSGESEEEQEIPDSKLAFTGTFDGGGHTISNLKMEDPEAMAVGLFGCIANAKVGNFTLKTASVEGTIMVSDVVGYAFSSEVHDVALKSGRVVAHAGELSGEGMYGGIVGAGMASQINGCKASATIVIPDDTANAGIVGGGLEMTSVTNCTASGTVVAGDNCYGIGGISGCGFGSEQFTDNNASNVTIVVGDNVSLVGGITGYTGGFKDEKAGVPVTVVKNCDTKNVMILVGDKADQDTIGEIVGGGFYSEAAAEMMGAPFDEPTVYELIDCDAA